MNISSEFTGDDIKNDLFLGDGCFEEMVRGKGGELRTRGS